MFDVKIKEVYAVTIDGVEHLLQVNDKHENEQWWGVIEETQTRFSYDCINQKLVVGGNSYNVTPNITTIHLYVGSSTDMPFKLLRQFMLKQYGMDFTHISDLRDDRLSRPKIAMHVKVGLTTYMIYGYHPTDDDLILARMIGFDWSKISWSENG